MSGSEKFFRAMAWLCFGIIVGLFLSPIKNGVSICSNNRDISFGSDPEEDDEEETEEIVLK